jgi:hypothetical protein
MRMASNIFTKAPVVKGPRPEPRKPKVNWATNPYARAKKAQKHAQVLAGDNQKLRDEVAKIPLLEQQIARLTEEVNGLWELIGALNKERKGH